MGTILDRIMRAKREELDITARLCPLVDVRAALADAPPVRPFESALAGGGPIKLIAEVKKASPSKGIIRADFRPLDIARDYQRHGATCLSVLTDREFFQGSLDILRSVRETVALPVLRKDFVLDVYQVLEARAVGADAVLLIAECLRGDQLRRLYDAIRELDMTPLVELHKSENLERVLDLGATLVGVNNRDLETFKVDLDRTIRIRRQVPAGCTVVAESGIQHRRDVKRLEEAHVHAMLVGERLMASRDIGTAVDTLLGSSHSV
ncbi:MAG: indole-3-glycerol phosphate synthase TrpC [Planctomycetota bacterium]